MLTEERQALILKMVEDDGSASVQDLMAFLDASESTIRRDLTSMAKKGMLTKVHGGAITNKGIMTAIDPSIEERSTLNLDEKQSIAKYAADMIHEGDTIFLDAGTTTGLILDYLDLSLATDGGKVTFVTNAVTHARKLSAMGFKVYVPGGYLKDRTEALVGAETCAFLNKTFFSKGFFGTNGATITHGCTTPDIQEAAVKEAAMLHCREKYVLADASKFGKISTKSFSQFSMATFITAGEVPDRYREQENVILV